MTTAVEESKQQEREVPQQINLSKAIFRIQSALLDVPRCAENQLLSAGSVLSRPDYDDVVTERCIAGLCGYPLCSNQLPPERPRRGRYRISLREHRVYDLQESYSFCSEECLIGSRAFAGTLADERCWDLSQARILQVLALFDREEGNHDSVPEVLVVQEKKKGGSLDNDDLGLSKLTIWEKGEVSARDMPLQDWAGPTNAIDGYVPQRERENGSVHKPIPKFQSSSKLPPMGNMEIMDFTSEIFGGDDLLPFHAKDLSSSSHSKFLNKITKDRSDDFATKFDLVCANDTVVGDPSHVGAHQQNPSSFLHDFTDSQWIYSEVGGSEGAQVMGQNSKPSLKVTGRNSHNHTVKWADKDKKDDSLTNDGDGQKSQGQVNVPQLKSSLKLSGKKSHNHTVKWADKDGGNNFSAEDVDSGGKPHLHEDVNIEGYASADVSTSVSLMASVVVESKMAAVNEEAVKSYSDTYQEEPTSRRDFFKWPKKPALPESDIFDTTDSWHDAPPEGFNLKLSSFATMWMALFSWVSCSSLAYIYGQSEESCEEFLFVNGREYPKKSSLSDGRSLEIKQTLASCLERCLPQVVSNLRLPTSISIIEKAMGQLLETMSFIDAIPPFKTDDWNVIVVLFVDALSVFRIQALTRHMVDNRVLLRKLQVLDSAYIGNDEYEAMKDLLMPLGRDSATLCEKWGLASTFEGGRRFPLPLLV